MKVFHTFFCFLFIALQDGNAEFVNEENKLFRRKEGENITVGCSFIFSGRTKLFCRETCEEGNILIETTENNHQRGRYSIKYESKPLLLADIMHVSINHLETSDSGHYRCAVERFSVPDSYEDFQIVVTEDSTTSQPKSTLPTFPPSEQSFSSTSGTSNPPSTSSEDTRKQNSPPPPSYLYLYMGLILVVKIFIFSMPLVILCKKRRSIKPKGRPVDTIYVNISESSRVIEEIIEDKQISSPPVETS